MIENALKNNSFISIMCKQITKASRTQAFLKSWPQAAQYCCTWAVAYSRFKAGKWCFLFYLFIFLGTHQPLSCTTGIHAPNSWCLPWGSNSCHIWFFPNDFRWIHWIQWIMTRGGGNHTFHLELWDCHILPWPVGDGIWHLWHHPWR